MSLPSTRVMSRRNKMYGHCTLHIHSIGARAALTQGGALLGLRLVQQPRGLHAKSVQKNSFTLTFCLSGFLLW